MTVTQTTPRVVIDWQSFGIKAGESLRFEQPSRASVALNRVVGAEPSRIMGSLSSNGQVFVVNPQGVLFGPGASVNVGGLVASSLNIVNADFLSGHYRFESAGQGTVRNQGLLQASGGGYVALLGSQVINEGVVQAQRGTVALAAGQAVTLDVLGDRLLNVVVDRGVLDAWVDNSGKLQADGGRVIMTTQAASDVLANAVNNTGVVQAQTLENQHGTLVLLGGMAQGELHLGGVLDVGAGPEQSAGRVEATAHHVGVWGAQIQASGGTGGGTVLLGGGVEGKNPLLAHASATFMSPDSQIHADATGQGHGGTVVLWSDGQTRAQGVISARGGEQSGHGGWVETSGRGLHVTGLQVDTRAVQGQFGTWLLDPADVTISSATTTDASASGGVFSPDSGVGVAHINVADLVTALGGTNVTVTTTNTGASGTGLGDIHVNAAVTWTAPTRLTLNAVRDVNVNQAITGTDGSLAVLAGRDVNVAAVVTTTTGNLAFTAVQDVKLTAATTITTGNLLAVAGRDVTVAAPATVTTGRMELRADNDGTGPGQAAGSVDITCGLSCLTVTTGELSIRFNPVSYASTPSEILAYGAKLTGGGTLDAKAWVFGQGDNKLYDGTPQASVSGLRPDQASVAPPVILGAVTVAEFDSRDVGVNKPIVFASTFDDAAYALFATQGMTAGTYQARADIVVRPLSVNAVTDARPYNGSTSSVGVPTVNGLQVGDSLNGGLTQAFASQHVLGSSLSTLVANGSYTVSDGNGGNNYAVTVLTAPGTITPVPLTVTAQNVSKVYGQAPALTAFSTTGLVNGETVGSVSLASAGQPVTASVAGSPYAITASDAAGGTFAAGNYTIAYVNGALTITPAALTVTAQNVNKTYGQAPTLSAFSTTGLVNGETVGSVSLASAGQPATASVAGSPYAITASDAAGGTFAAGNYSIAYVSGVLTVVAAAVVPPVEPPVVEPPVVEPPVVEPPVVEPPVVEPPVVEPPVVEPPVVEPPVVEPPVVEPPVVEPPVVVPPVVEPPVVVPPIVEPPVVEPPVVEPPVVDLPTDQPVVEAPGPVVAPELNLAPDVPLVVIAADKKTTEPVIGVGVKQPPTSVAVNSPVPVAPLAPVVPTAVPAVPSGVKPPAPAPVVQPIPQAKPPVRRLPMPVARPLKQDRN
jgi:filamentous hemagglutinin family protein